MTCFFCKGDMEDGLTTHVAEINESIILVKNVPCLKCDQCGEVSYTGTVYEHLESIIDTIQNDLTEVTIVKYPGSAA